MGNSPRKGKIDATTTNSETTIYQIILEKDSNHYDTDDPEITFKTTEANSQAKLRDSTSSEDQIDTSDEMLEVDINERFIADCAD